MNYSLLILFKASKILCVAFTLLVANLCQGQSIASVTLSYDDEDFPLYDITISNHTDSHIVITGLNIDLLEFVPKGTLGSISSGELKTLARWSLNMPYKKDLYKFNPVKPIKIDRDDSGLIQIRLYSIFKGNKVPTQKTGFYRFKFEMVVGGSNILKSGEIKLGKAILLEDGQ